MSFIEEAYTYKNPHCNYNCCSSISSSQCLAASCGILWHLVALTQPYHKRCLCLLRRSQASTPCIPIPRGLFGVVGPATSGLLLLISSLGAQGRTIEIAAFFCYCGGSQILYSGILTSFISFAFFGCLHRRLYSQIYSGRPGIKFGHCAQQPLWQPASPNDHLYNAAHRPVSHNVALRLRTFNTSIKLKRFIL